LESAIFKKRGKAREQIGGRRSETDRATGKKLKRDVGKDGVQGGLVEK